MPKFSVKKPFTVLVAVILVVVLGFVSLAGMQTDLVPNMNLPYLLVVTTYPGASPEQVESDVTQPLENSLSTLNGVKNVTSQSNENYSLVILEYQDDTDMDSAMVKASTVTFNPAIDYVVRLDRELLVGDVNRAKGEDCVLGGKGINVSGVLAQLGCESVALGFVAGETGAWLERGLAEQGLKTDFVRLAQGMTRINVKIKAGQETELNGAGPDIPEDAMQALEEKLDRLQQDDILVLAGSIPASLAQTTYERILARLEGRGVRAVVDATRDLLVNVLRYRPFLIKPNNHELSEITGVKLTTDREIAAAAKMMQDKGARNVLVSMAGDGALLLDEQGGVHRIGCPKGKVVNSVGAGDSMVAGFVAGYQQSGGDYEAALRLGTACGSATAFSLGLATKADIDKLLKTME